MSSIKLSQSARLAQVQSIKMNQQMQHAIKMLTLTRLEMINEIEQQLSENPLLEQMEENPDHDESQIEQDNHEATANDFTQEAIVDNAKESKEEIDWDAYLEQYNNNSSTPSTSSTVANTSNSSDPDDQFNYENIVTKSMSLTEHLEWQLRMENLTEEEWDLAEEIIHNLNEDGYLDCPFDDIISKSKLDREDAFEILRMIQHLDPLGCGARDLEECLLIQARHAEERSPLVELLITKHLEHLKKKDYNEISKITGVVKEKIKDAELVISNFHPKPGRLIGGDDTQYVMPDIYVHQVGNEFVVQLNDEGMPRLRLAKEYLDLAKGSKDAEIVDYMKSNKSKAEFLIKSIDHRQKTIVKVAEAIVRYQPEFFKKGPQYLKPMILKDIANEIGVHESTVSRTTTNKYMHTPIGIFELKYFFNAGIGGDKGGIDIAGEALKLKIKNLIEKENPKRPLSDQKIVEMLSSEDVVVARRTVAKYREMMDIPSSATRKLK